MQRLKRSKEGKIARVLQIANIRSVTKFRSSHPDVFYKNDFRNYAKLIGIYICQGLFYNRVAGWSPATTLKRDSATGVLLQSLTNF